MRSVNSFWEVILKYATGKLDVGDPRIWWEIALGDFAATVLPLRPAHVAEIHGWQTCEAEYGGSVRP